ncbi:hypothetical protein [Kitasatospora sp. P5_F3]
MAEPSPTLAELRLPDAAGGAAPLLRDSRPWRFRPVPDTQGLYDQADQQRSS